MFRMLTPLLLCLCFTVHAQHREDEGYAMNGSVPIYYHSFGQGSPLLIINGGPGMNSNGFAALAQQLAGAAVRTIIYDQRGTGRSTVDHPDSTNITMQLMADDLERLRRHLHIDRWAVLGHSFGGMLAAYYSVRYPQHITKLILSSSGGLDLALLSTVQRRIDARLSKAQHDSLRIWNARIDAGDSSHAARLGRGRALAPAYLYRPDHIPQIAERLTQTNNRVNGLVWSDMQRTGYDCKQALRSFSAPVLIIQGREDIIDPEIARTEARTFPNAQLVFMDRCVHYGWLDRPDIYFPAIRDFLAKN